MPAVAFLVLLVCGVLREELTWKGVAGFVIVVAGAIPIWKVLNIPGYLFLCFLVVIDIILILKIFKGDVKIR